MENYSFDTLGKELSKNGIAAIYGHNRGYNHINDIKVSDSISEDGGYETKRYGVVYEIFEECLFDISAWINKAKDLGYSNIIL